MLDLRRQSKTLNYRQPLWSGNIFRFIYQFWLFNRYIYRGYNIFHTLISMSFQFSMYTLQFDISRVRWIKFSLWYHFTWGIRSLNQTHLIKKSHCFLVCTSFLSLKGDEKNLYFEIGMKNYLFFPFLSEKTTISGVALSFASYYKTVEIKCSYLLF